MSDVENELKVQLQEIKARASQLSGDVDRSKREIGSRDDRIIKLEEQVASIDGLKAENAELASRLKASEAALKSAQQLADNGKKAVDAGKQIGDALATLASL